MKAILDTNVLVSGLLCPSGAPGEIVRMLVSGVIELIYDARIIWEYEEVLKTPKFGIPEQLVGDIVVFVKHCGHVTAAPPLKTRLSDINDEPFLEAAISGRSDFLITGNVAHYQAPARHGVKVVSPAEFIAEHRRT